MIEDMFFFYPGLFLRGRGGSLTLGQESIFKSFYSIKL